MSMSQFIVRATTEPNIIMIDEGKKLITEIYKFNKNLEKFDKYLPNTFKVRLLLQNEIKNLFKSLQQGENNVNSEI